MTSQHGREYAARLAPAPAPDAGSMADGLAMPSRHRRRRFAGRESSRATIPARKHYPVMEDGEPTLWKGALAGVAAGLAASFAMDRFQAVISGLSSANDQSEPATEKAADRLAEASTGAPISAARKPMAGQAVHYALGSALGMFYGVVAEFAPKVSAGGGTAFGLAAAIVLDEAAVPAAGLGKVPWKTPASIHAYTLSSHLVFGAVAEGVRRLARRALG